MLKLKIVTLLLIRQAISKNNMIPYDQECFSILDTVSAPNTSLTDTSLSDMDKLT